MVPHQPSTSSPLPIAAHSRPFPTLLPTPAHVPPARVPCPSRSPGALPLPLAPGEVEEEAVPQTEPGLRRRVSWGGACSPPCEGGRGEGEWLAPSPQEGSGASHGGGRLQPPQWDQGNSWQLRHRQRVWYPPVPTASKHTETAPHLLKPGQ